MKTIFLLITIFYVIYAIHKNGIIVIKNPNKFTFYNYNNELISVYLGEEYSGEGYSGLTDDVQVIGKLVKVDIQFDSATIWDKKLDMPCAVKLRSISK